MEWSTSRKVEARFSAVHPGQRRAELHPVDQTVRRERDNIVWTGGGGGALLRSNRELFPLLIARWLVDTRNEGSFCAAEGSPAGRDIIRGGGFDPHPWLGET